MTLSTAFGCPYEGPVDVDRVVDVAQRLVDHGARAIGLADTIGVAVPTEVATLVEVTYVFGPRLPKHGRCVTSDKEMARIDARKAAYQGYVVEVCVDCGWNHLTRSRALGGSTDS